MRDLLALDVDVSALLPPDDSSFGFDNMASSLSVSSALLEAYLAAASKISRLAIGDMSAAPNQKTFVAPADLSQSEHVDGLPFGTRGGMVIHHTFPADGEYVFQIALLRGTSEELYGRISKDEQLELSIDGQRVNLFDIDAEERNRKKVDNVTPPLEVRASVTAGFAYDRRGLHQKELRRRRGCVFEHLPAEFNLCTGCFANRRAARQQRHGRRAFARYRRQRYCEPPTNFYLSSDQRSERAHSGARQSTDGCGIGNTMCRTNYFDADTPRVSATFECGRS